MEPRVGKALALTALGVVGFIATTAIVMSLVATSDTEAYQREAASQYQTSVQEQTKVEYAKAEMVDAGSWVPVTGRSFPRQPQCRVKLTNLAPFIANLNATVVAESLDGTVKYRSASFHALNLSHEQSETVTVNYFGEGAGPELPMDTDFVCRVAGDVAVKVAP